MRSYLGKTEGSGFLHFSRLFLRFQNLETPFSEALGAKVARTEVPEASLRTAMAARGVPGGAERHSCDPSGPGGGMWFNLGLANEPPQSDRFKFWKRRFGRLRAP